MHHVTNVKGWSKLKSCEQAIYTKKSGHQTFSVLLAFQQMGQPACFFFSHSPGTRILMNISILYLSLNNIYRLSKRFTRYIFPLTFGNKIRLQFLDAFYLPPTEVLTFVLSKLRTCRLFLSLVLPG